jgi:hypothetical protein
MTKASDLPLHALAAASVLAVLFVALALLNSGGYRYGAGDQAFYIPATLRHLDPALFPRDRLLIDPQDRLNLFTRAMAGVASATGVGLPWLFWPLSLATLVLLGGALFGLGLTLLRSPWSTAALVAAGTLRHAVAMGAVNTLEGYMHPRLLAFAIGLWGILFFLRGRSWAALLAVVVAALAHPTTAAWFGIALGVAILVGDRPARRFLLPAGLLLGGCVVVWGLTSGRLAGAAARMDATWLSALAGKRYLFATEWPVAAWAPVTLYALVLGWIYLVRRRVGFLTSRETGLLAGMLALLAIFVLSLPLVAARVVLAVQLQIPRVLWLADLLATVYLIWFLAEGPWTARLKAPARVPLIVCAAVAALALARGAYVVVVEHPERRLVEIDLPASDWHDVMRWLGTTPPDAYVLADPGHAWRYGSSVRVSSRRDVFLEEAKDAAIALYSRDGALRVIDRIRALGDFQGLTADRARALAVDYGLDYLVTDRLLELPVAYQNARFRVYRLE